MRESLRARGDAIAAVPHDPLSADDGSLASNITKPKASTILTFQPSDPEDPRNWPRWKKWSIIGSIILVDLSVSFGASGFSPAETSFEKDMHVSSVVATLGLSLYVAGLAWGPVCYA